MTKHTPTPWIKEVRHEPTRTPEEVALFAGPNAGYVLRAVNAHEAMLTALKNVLKAHNDELDEGGKSFVDEDEVKQAIAKAEAR